MINDISPTGSRTMPGMDWEMWMDRFSISSVVRGSWPTISKDRFTMCFIGSLGMRYRPMSYSPILSCES